MKLYSELADWYTLLTPLEEYEEEGNFFCRVFQEHLGAGRHRLLELGAGAGHNAHYLQEHFDLTLVDITPEMLTLAGGACPTAHIVVGDMRSVRLNDTFDAVFIHDAVAYMVSEMDLRAALRTAWEHLRPDGVLLLAPDVVQETFEPGEDSGGTDADDRSIRYLEWNWQRAGQPQVCVVDYIIATRQGEDPPKVYADRHEEGIFPRATWLRLLEEEGFDAENRRWQHSQQDQPLDIFVARRRSEVGLVQGE